MQNNFNKIDSIWQTNLSEQHKKIIEKVYNQQRITPEEGLFLYNSFELGQLGILANFIRENLNGNHAFFIRNFHIEPTNVCLFNCLFCSYRRKLHEPGNWEFTLKQIEQKCIEYDRTKVSEVHVVGGVHPNHDLEYYAEIIRTIRKCLPSIFIKAYSAVELHHIISKSGKTIKEGLLYLKECGLDSIPGGGAEIFDEEIRRKICPDKANAEQWLNIHKEAHLLGITTNATLLYGHIENYKHRIDHLERIRNLQDQTNGFMAFIPLKYRKENNNLNYLGETTIIEDLKNYAVSRIYLDNINHIKAYWPMLGKDITQLSLSFGVDDIDGTIDDSTKIYSMAGVNEKNTMNSKEMIDLIKRANRLAIERDGLYNKL